MLNPGRRLPTKNARVASPCCLSTWLLSPVRVTSPHACPAQVSDVRPHRVIVLGLRLLRDMLGVSRSDRRFR